MLDARVSEGWYLINRALPCFNVVKFERGYRSLFSFIHESIQNREVDDLKVFRSQIYGNVIRIRKRELELRERILRGEKEYETEMLSHDITAHDLEALGRVIERIEKTPEPLPIPNETSIFRKTWKEYQETKNERLLKRLDTVIANALIKDDEKFVKKLENIAGELDRKIEDFIGPLAGYRTILSSYLNFKAIGLRHPFD